MARFAADRGVCIALGEAIEDFGLGRDELEAELAAEMNKPDTVALSEPRARVRLTDDAVANLGRLQRKDPQIVREIFKKMFLLERATGAGEPLLGALVGFRKLVFGDRDYRIV